MSIMSGLIASAQHWYCPRFVVYFFERVTERPLQKDKQQL